MAWSNICEGFHWFSLFQLVYGSEAKLPIQMQLPILEFLKAFPNQQNAMQSRINQLIESDENRRKSFDQIGRSHDKMKAAFKYSRHKAFNPDDLVLLWDKRREKPGMHKKWDNL